MSDTHGVLPVIPECDLLLIAGDVCPVQDHSLDAQREFLHGPFKRWLEEVPARDVVLVAGNHDFIFERLPEAIPTDWRCTYLLDREARIQGLRVYGTPWQPWFTNWAFNLYEPDLAKKFALIPDGIDVLVCHSPPEGFGDMLLDGEAAGSSSLLGAIQRVRPKLTVFGHVHEGRGRWQLPFGTLANVAVLNAAYDHVHPPMQFEM